MHLPPLREAAGYYDGHPDFCPPPVDEEARLQDLMDREERVTDEEFMQLLHDRPLLRQQLETHFNHHEQQRASIPGGLKICSSSSARSA